METDLEILAASPLWDDTPTSNIPIAYRLLATLQVVAPHYPTSDQISQTILRLWLTGVPIILEQTPIDNPAQIDYPEL